MNILSLLVLLVSPVLEFATDSYDLGTVVTAQYVVEVVAVERS